MKNTLSRRDFVRSGALAAGVLAASSDVFVLAQERPSTNEASAIRLGMASYTFRNFSRAQMIGFLKQLKVFDLNAKDVKDHLPMDIEKEAAALAEYAAMGIGLHGAGTIYFEKDEDADIRSKFEYCKRAGISVIVAGDPAPGTLPRIEKFVKKYDIRIAIHNHGPEDKLWRSPLDVLKSVKDMDPRIGCCIDVGHTVRAGTDVVQAISKQDRGCLTCT
jgi:sugar phosphate isomerase/epimerase